MLIDPSVVRLGRAPDEGWAPRLPQPRFTGLVPQVDAQSFRGGCFLKSEIDGIEQAVVHTRRMAYSMPSPVVSADARFSRRARASGAPAHQRWGHRGKGASWYPAFRDHRSTAETFCPQAPIFGIRSPIRSGCDTAGRRQTGSDSLDSGLTEVAKREAQSARNLRLCSHGA